MSSHRLPVDISSRARDDYEAIVLHSLLTWGDEQAQAYEAQIDRAFEDLGAFPELGRAREDVAPGCRGHLVEQHVIYDRVEEHTVRILRILHQRMGTKGRVGSSDIE